MIMQRDSYDRKRDRALFILAAFGSVVPDAGPRIPEDRVEAIELRRARLRALGD